MAPLGSTTSMHNHRSLFNMDISGGMPAVIIKMLVASEPGKIKLLPALPQAWPKGTIEGVLCRGAIEIRSLKWDGNRVKATLFSAKSQTLTLELPTAISTFTVTAGGAKAAKLDAPNQRQLTLAAGKEVSIEIQG